MILIKKCSECGIEFKCDTKRSDESGRCDCEYMACKCLTCWVLASKNKNISTLKNHLRIANLCFSSTDDNFEVKTKSVLEKIINELVLNDL